MVAYPLVDLRRLGIYVKEYVYRLEQALLKTLESYGVTGHRVRRRAGHLRPARRPVRPRRADRPGRPARPVRGPRQDRRARHQGEPPLHLPRRGAERRDGPAALRRHQPVRLCRAETVDLATIGVRTPTGTTVAEPLGAKLRRLPEPLNAHATRPTSASRPAGYDADAPSRRPQAKTARIPIKIVPAETLKKPDWIRVKAGSPTTRFYEIKQILREHKLHTVCEEASCPNIGECFGKGTATFMIMGDKCTRRCPFCDVGHGRPDPLDADEPLEPGARRSPR